MQFRNRSQRRSPSEVNITPLIDIVFQLLIFFLITTTFVQNPGIEVDLPKASAEPMDVESNSVIIAITSEGRLVHEGAALSADELKTRLRSHFAQRPSAVVIIQADSETPHGKVVEVMDIARQIGFSDLAIATEAQ